MFEQACLFFFSAKKRDVYIPTMAILQLTNYFPASGREHARVGVACVLFHAGCNCKCRLTYTIFIPAFVLKHEDICGIKLEDKLLNYINRQSKMG